MPARLRIRPELPQRVIDVVGSAIGLVLAGPVIALAAVAVWLQDGGSPLYRADRMGLDGRRFRMIKLRSMVVHADAVGIDSTSASDPRVTTLGQFLRRFKIDELPQLWNVLKGDMSLVGPRPQVEREVALYTRVERQLFSVRPGITDFSSIVFADLAEILKESSQPDIAYNQLVRPGKSRLGLFYVTNRSVWLDLRLIGLTVAAMISRRAGLRGVQRVLRRLGASADLVELAGRTQPLVPAPPPGAQTLVVSRLTKDVALEP